MKKLIVLMLFPLLLFAQEVPMETLNEATEKWAYHYEGNPIDGKTRMALKVNNEFEENIFILEIINSAESIKIENSTYGEGDNRDDIIVDIRTNISVKNLDEVLMYFDNEDKFYNVNFRTYGDKVIIWGNAVQNNKKGFLSKFNFIDQLKIRNTVYFRFKYSDKDYINASFSLNQSSIIINKVVDLTNIFLEKDWRMDTTNGIINLQNILKDSLFQKDILTLNIDSLEDFYITLTDYLTEKIGPYALAITRYKYDGNLSLRVLNFNDKQLMVIDLKQFKK